MTLQRGPECLKPQNFNKALKAQLIIMAVDILVWGIYILSLYYSVFWFLVYLDGGMKEKKPIQKKFPKITIAIPAYNEEKTILATIKSVIALNYPKNKMEILVINDGSKDNTAKVVRNFIRDSNFNIRLINQANKGKGAAMNNALKQATGELFISLDADSYVRPDALQVITPYFEDPKVSSVLPIIKVRQSNSIMRKLQYVEYLINFFFKKLMAKLDCIHVTPGPFSVYRRDILRNLGGFDEKNLTEDLEMAMRLQKHHYKIVQILGTEVTTDAPINFVEFYKQRNRWYKGALLNLWAYRKMIFNKKYGEFGMFHLPAVYSVAVIAILYATYISYKYAIKPISSYLYDMSFISYNIPFMVSEVTEKFSLLDLNYMTLFYGMSLLVLSFIIMKLSFRYTHERMREALLPASLYVIIYPPILAVTWLGVVFDLVRGKKQKW